MQAPLSFLPWEEDKDKEKKSERAYARSTFSAETRGKHGIKNFFSQNKAWIQVNSIGCDKKFVIAK